jgi:hypothetical protein
MTTDAEHSTVVKCWTGSRGSIVLTKHLDLELQEWAVQGETFVVDVIDLGDVRLAGAVRELQGVCAALQERVWEVDDA